MLTRAANCDSSQYCPICERSIDVLPALLNNVGPCQICSTILWSIDRTYYFNREFVDGKLKSTSKFTERETNETRDLTEVFMGIEEEFDLNLSDKELAAIHDLNSAISVVSRFLAATR